MFSSRGTVRYEERGQGYRDIEKVGKPALHVSGIFSAHHREFSTVHSALVSFRQV